MNRDTKVGKWRKHTCSGRLIGGPHACSLVDSTSTRRCRWLRRCSPFVAVVLVGVGVAAPLAAPVDIDVDAPLVVLLDGAVSSAVAEGIAARES